MVSSRDRNCQRIEMTREVIARAPPPAFLFPNQQCQRPRAEAPRTTSQRNHPLAPDVGGGGYLSNLEFRVKPFFTKPSEPIRQNQPKPIPTNRSSLLKKTANPVNKEFQRNTSVTSEGHQRILANSSINLPEPRLLEKAKHRVNLEESRTSANYRSRILHRTLEFLRTLHFGEERRFY